MNSLILQTTARYLLPVLLLYSVFLLWIGHNKSGGGFIGGLLAAAAVALISLAFDAERARRILPISPRQLLAVGMLTSGTSGIFSLFRQEPFLTASWINVKPLEGVELHLGTPLLFDIGVFLTVIGAVLMMFLPMAEEGKAEP